jgi:hypothetical protein
MYVIQKLKPDRSITGLIPSISSLMVAAILGIFFGPEVAFTFLAIFFWGFSLYTFLGYIRTMNPGFLVPALYMLFAGIMVCLWSPGGRDRSTLARFASVWTLFFLVFVIYLTATKKIKWRGREILELAAIPVEDTGNGYTSRPLPAGKTEYSQRQIMEFAEFARRKLIAVSYVGKDKVVFVPVMMGREAGFILGLKSDYTDETWVSFDFEGNVTVNISHRDYLNYKEALSFDQLCGSLGDLFIEFMEMYLRGEGVRIIDRMDSVGVGIFS